MVKDEKIPIRKVKFVDIEEDQFGVDVMTFEYQNNVYKSYVYRG